MWNCHTYCTVYHNMMWGRVTACSDVFYLYILVAQLLRSFTISLKWNRVQLLHIHLVSFQHTVNGWDADCLGFSKMLSSMIELFIPFSIMALFSTTMVQIASSCSGVKRARCHPCEVVFQSYVGKKCSYAKHKIKYKVYLLYIMKHCRKYTVLQYC